MFRTIIVAAALIVALAIGTLSQMAVAVSQEAPKAGTYSDAMKTCGAEWKASETRKTTPKGQGMAAWQAFRKECVARVGYVSKRNPAK